MRWAKTSWNGVQVYVIRMNLIEKLKYWVDFQKAESEVRKRGS